MIKYVVATNRNITAKDIREIGKRIEIKNLAVAMGENRRI